MDWQACSSLSQPGPDPMLLEYECGLISLNQNDCGLPAIRPSLRGLAPLVVSREGADHLRADFNFAPGG
jgi:hypothetical protein